MVQQNFFESDLAQMLDNPLTSHQVLRRSGEITPFNAEKIAIAISKAFVATNGDDHSQATKEIVKRLTTEVVEVVTNRTSSGRPIHVEDIQDQVELALMHSEQYKVARAYVLYREKRSTERKIKEQLQQEQNNTMTVLDNAGISIPLDLVRLKTVIEESCEGISDVSPDFLLKETLRNIYSNIPQNELETAMVMSARMMVEAEPNYTYVGARLLLNSLRVDALSAVLGESNRATSKQMHEQYPVYFPKYIKLAIEKELLDPRLAIDFDLGVLGQAIDAMRDNQFTLLGLQTLFDRYFIHTDGLRIELPQSFFMRVAMGLALNEQDKEQRAIEFYNLLSKFDFMSSTPTLFNSGTLRPQLSSCYLTTISDDLDNIYESMKDNALLSKFAGGLGNDWTPVRAMGAHIKGTNGKSQGVVPFLKVANDTAVAVNQGGKRKGAVCAYLETWHWDIEEFLELRKNTGDERRRTHDMNTANWVPDLFMKRVANEEQWTLFSPNDTSDLHDLYGLAFEKRYVEYEALAASGEIRHKKIQALGLWRKMLGMLFETGHPWITFKDTCNIRSSQQHIGVVHSSNLCTEITLNTSREEIAVCNLGSINLVNHITKDGKLDVAKVKQTVDTGMRMLDNVIEYNYYSVKKAEVSNLRHRPVGLGLMGFHDALYKLSISYASEEAVDFADRSMELISYYAIEASTNLAEERGTYKTFEGSLWSQGILPIDSLNQLSKERKGLLKQDTSQTLDWDTLRERVKQVGMRNSNTMAIAPTATISNIVGVSQSIEPTYQNLYTKSNLSGNFTVINEYLVRYLKTLDLWDESMLTDLKYYDGSVGPIDRIPDQLKEIFATAFEIDAAWLIECASRRQKWLDQAQSLNLYTKEPDGKKLDQIYKGAWIKGLKTTYYLRSVGASHAEKSTLNEGKLQGVKLGEQIPNICAICAIGATDCEACQ